MLGWDGGPSLQLLWPEITQGQVHRDKHTISASTKVIQVHREKDTQKSTERERERGEATLREESMAVWQVWHYRWMRALRGEMTMRSIHWSPSRGLYPHSDM